MHLSEWPDSQSVDRYIAVDLWTDSPQARNTNSIGVFVSVNDSASYFFPTRLWR
jgi:hypothetical protein